MKFSIVTISYNQAVFLERAIKSVLDQNYTDIEYIVVDPGSTDGSREIIRKYEDQISHIIFEADSGPADGLNKGFALATGDVLGFLNADDELLHGAISRMAEVFETYSNADVISGNGLVVDECGVVIRQSYSHKFNQYAYVHGACVLFQQSTFFTRYMYLKAGGFNAKNRVSWDGELWFEMALQGARFHRIPDKLGLFRVYAESITGSNKHNDAALLQLQRLSEKIGEEQKSVWVKRWHWFIVRIGDPWLLMQKIRNLTK